MSNLYDVIVKKKGRKNGLLAYGVTKPEADAVKKEWADIYTPDVFMDPVPELKVISHKEEEPES